MTSKQAGHIVEIAVNCVKEETGDTVVGIAVSNGGKIIVPMLGYGFVKRLWNEMIINV